MIEKFINDVKTLGVVFTFSDVVNLYQDDYEMYGMAPTFFQMCLRSREIRPMDTLVGEQLYTLH